MKLIDAFIGSAQSKFAAIAIVGAVLVVCITLIFTKEKVPIEQKLFMALMLFIVCIPSILYILFQMTCIVTGAGGKSGSTWWCGVYAWILLAIIVLYSIIVVVMSIMSVTTEGSMKATENFHNKKQLYEKFASEMVKDEKEEKPKGVVDYSPEASTQGAVETFGPRVEEPQAIGGAVAVAEVPHGVVSATVEKFTSCGAEIPMQSATR